MRRTLKRTKSKKQQGRVPDLKPAKEVKGSGKIEHAVERHETAVSEDAKELKMLREEVTQIKSDIAHILEALQTLETWVPMSRTEIPQYAWAYRKFVDITTRLRQEARSR
jgi:phage-related tail protein